MSPDQDQSHVAREMATDQAARLRAGVREVGGASGRRPTVNPLLHVDVAGLYE